MTILIRFLIYVTSFFPCVRRWRKYPDQIRDVTAPEDFPMSAFEYWSIGKLNNLIVRYDFHG